VADSSSACYSTVMRHVTDVKQMLVKTLALRLAA
jgi:hypothetical protein